MTDHEPRDQQPTEGRALHLLDLDDLAGPGASVTRIKEVLDRYLQGAAWDLDDHVVVAAGCGLLGDAAVDLDTGWRLVAGRDPDGTDRARLHTTDPRLVARRYDRLVVGSGHARFAPLLGAVADRGTPAWVVARTLSSSREARDAATHTVELDRVPRRPVSLSA